MYPGKIEYIVTLHIRIAVDQGRDLHMPDRSMSLGRCICEIELGTIPAGVPAYSERSDRPCMIDQSCICEIELGRCSCIIDRSCICGVADLLALPRASSDTSCLRFHGWNRCLLWRCSYRYNNDGDTVRCSNTGFLSAVREMGDGWCNLGLAEPASAGGDVTSRLAVRIWRCGCGNPWLLGRCELCNQ